MRPPVPDRCPDVRSLEHYLLGLGSADDGLTDHLTTCRVCGERMRRTPAEDAVVAAVREAKTLVQAEPPRGLRGLAPLLKCLRPRDATATWLGPGERTAGGVTYSFLRPAIDPSYLGSLGPYRVLEVLGAGGMGVVFRARDERLDRELAVKVIKPGLRARPKAVEQFLNEARAAAAVEHDNIVPVYQADEADGTPFLAMPLLRGESLEARLQREAGPLPVGEILRIGRETAAGLAAAHARGLIHRDVKPANLWLEEAAGGRVKILDFGLAAVAADGPTAEVAGTPAYMAPEQAGGKGVDGRADLFSLGCVLYRAATGRPAFQGETLVSTLFSVLHDRPQPPRQLNAALPPGLAALIVELIAKAPDERPATAAAVAERIARLEAPRRSWMSRRGWLVLASGGGLATGVGLWAWFGQKPQPRAEPFAGELRKHDKHTRAVTALALVAVKDDWLVVSAGLDRRVWLWKTTADETTPLRPNRGGSFFDVPLLALGVSPDGRRVAVGGGDKALPDNNRFWQWDLDARRELPVTIDPHPGLIQALAYDGTGGRVVEGRSDGLISVWDVAAGKGGGGYADRDPKRANLGIHAVAANAEFAVAGGGDGSVIVLDLEPIAHRKTYPDAHGGGVSAVAVLADGGFVSGGRDGAIRVWDGGKPPRVLPAHDKAIHALAVNSDGARMVSGGADGTLRVWDLPAGKVVRELRGATAINAVAMYADGSHAVTGGADGAVRLWKLP